MAKMSRIDRKTTTSTRKKRWNFYRCRASAFSSSWRPMVWQLCSKCDWAVNFRSGMLLRSRWVWIWHDFALWWPGPKILWWVQKSNSRTAWFWHESQIIPTFSPSKPLVAFWWIIQKSIFITADRTYRIKNLEKIGKTHILALPVRPADQITSLFGRRLGLLSEFHSRCLSGCLCGLVEGCLSCLCVLARFASLSWFSCADNRNEARVRSPREFRTAGLTRILSKWTKIWIFETLAEK